MTNCQVEAPKLFRRMDGIYVENTDFPNGEQYFWDCKNIELKNVQIKGCDYAFMHSENIRIDNYRQDGNYAFQYAKNVEIQYTGLRPGEKLYEEVLNDLEGTKPTFHEKIRIAEVRDYDYQEVSKDIDELINISKAYDNMATVKKMKDIVPEYKSNNSVYEILDQ